MCRLFPPHFVDPFLEHPPPISVKQALRITCVEFHCQSHEWPCFVYRLKASVTLFDVKRVDLRSAQSWDLAVLLFQRKLWGHFQTPVDSRALMHDVRICIHVCMYDVPIWMFSRAGRLTYLIQLKNKIEYFGWDTFLAMNWITVRATGKIIVGVQAILMWMQWDWSRTPLPLKKMIPARGPQTVFSLNMEGQLKCAKGICLCDIPGNPGDLGLFWGLV